MSDILVAWKTPRWPFYSIVGFLLVGVALIYAATGDDHLSKFGALSIMMGVAWGLFAAIIGYWIEEETRCVLVTNTDDCYFWHFEFRRPFLWPIRSRMMIAKNKIDGTSGDPFWGDTGVMVNDKDKVYLNAIRAFEVHHDNLDRKQEGFRLLTEPETGD